MIYAQQKVGEEYYMLKTHLKNIELSDGITLGVWNLSRIAAGDRWFVRLEVSGDIPIKKKYFDGLSDADSAFAEAQKRFGSTMRYAYKRERIFVDQHRKDNAFKELFTTFDKNILPYMSKSDFWKKFVVSKYIEVKRNPYNHQKACR
jgi:hypothetical protein